MRACLTLCVLALAVVLAPGALLAQLNLEADLTVVDSFNYNKIFIGDMTNAWQFSNQFQHQYDHQAGFDAAFQGAGNSTFYLPVGNTHLSQANTGVAVGQLAGSAEGANLMNMSTATVAGMFTLTANLGAVGTNQTTLNSVVAFAAPAPAP